MPGTLSCIEGLQSRFPDSGGDDEAARRAALACWLTNPKNPLTWRSIVNRVWGWHFGRGLVTTPSDFGRMGSLPSHPELLDWLTSWFVQSDGSLKTLCLLNLAVRLRTAVRVVFPARRGLSHRSRRRRADQTRGHPDCLGRIGRELADL